MAAKYPVKYFDSNMTGAPTLSGTAVAGQLIALLDAVLLNGFGSKSVDSISVSGTEATMVISAGHTFKRGDVILVAGANESALNVEWKATWASTTQVKFTVPGGTPSGTGPITAKYAPQGDWEKASGCPTNYGLYRSKLTDGSECGLWVNDNSAGTAAPAAYAGANSAQTTSVWHKRKTPFNWGDTDFEFAKYAGAITYQRLCKSSANTANAKAWFMVADPYGAYVGIQLDGSSSSTGAFGTGNYFFLHYFGDINSFKAGDIFHFMNVGGVNNGVNAMAYMYNPSSDTHANGYYANSPFWLAQHNVQNTGILSDPMTYGGAILHRFWNGMEGVSIPQRFGGSCLSIASGSIDWWDSVRGDGKAGPYYPNPCNNGFLGQDVMISESYVGTQWGIRGKLPGFISPMVRFDYNNAMSNQRLYGVDYNGSSKDLALMQMAISYSTNTNGLSYPHIAFDLTSWR